MKKRLLDVIYASDKRKNVLLLLQNGSQKMEHLLDSIKTTRQALLPQIRILEDHHLVRHYNDTYELTTIGKLIVDDMRPLLSTVEVLGPDIDYWGTHNIDFIPPDLLKRMREFKNCKIINPSVTDLYSMHKSFHDKKNTGSVFKVTNFLYPDYRTIFNELLENNVTINYIVSQQLLDKIKTEHYEDFKFFIGSEFFNLYVYNNGFKFLFFTFDDFHIVISLLRTDGDFDGKFILCSDPDALKWGKDLFDHYLKDSTQITEL
ncbi:helix-turn-helix transcriptional regulator [Methanolobus profundi]|uniref:Predicted transcriptional regulator, contains HTH domain n=1 Tax=Methanolobus profundi TaxID=487685 RepID=A0A1I4PUG3_9EURY|nr:winged helix-turn-helix domain-containing protein [Methanolobus profundi]SFM31449.1 Predicted transcriptional regulator, contains HTH domain [Methanolobus profundi]